MSDVLKMSEAAALALHAMIVLAGDSDKPMTTKDIAESLKASEAHLSKVLQRLGKVGLVASIRGRKGGYLLGKRPKAITLLDVYESIEGPLASKDCLFGVPVCGKKKCVFEGLTEGLGSQVRKYLSGTNLAQLMN